MSFFQCVWWGISREGDGYEKGKGEGRERNWEKDEGGTINRQKGEREEEKPRKISDLN